MNARPRPPRVASSGLRAPEVIGVVGPEPLGKLQRDLVQRPERAGRSRLVSPHSEAGRSECPRASGNPVARSRRTPRPRRFRRRRGPPRRPPRRPRRRSAAPIERRAEPNLRDPHEGVRHAPVPALDHGVRPAEPAVRLVLVPVRHGNARTRRAPVLQIASANPKRFASVQGARVLVFPLSFWPPSSSAPSSSPPSPKSCCSVNSSSNTSARLFVAAPASPSRSTRSLARSMARRARSTLASIASSTVPRRRVVQR